MKSSDAFRRAFRVWASHPSQTARFLIVELCMTLAPLTPLLFLTGGTPAWPALLTVPFWLLWMLPVRVNAAAAMQNALSGGSLFTLQLADFSSYGKKLLFGLKRAFFLLLWSAPLIAGLIIARNHVAGDIDGFTMLRMIRSFGGGELMRGVAYLALILLALILLLAFGCAWHSGDRHAFVLGDAKRLSGRRWKLVLCWLCSLLALLPLIIAIVVLILRYMPVLMDLNGFVYGDVSLPSTRTSLIILAAGALLTLPFVPLRSLIIAAFVNGQSAKS